jgi:hypothetical protein
MNGENKEMTPVQSAKFLLHAKKYGLHYAIGFLVIEQLGILGEVTTYLGGVC